MHNAQRKHKRIRDRESMVQAGQVPTPSLLNFPFWAKQTTTRTTTSTQPSGTSHKSLSSLNNIAVSIQQPSIRFNNTLPSSLSPSAPFFSNDMPLQLAVPDLDMDDDIQGFDIDAVLRCLNDDTDDHLFRQQQPVAPSQALGIVGPTTSLLTDGSIEAPDVTSAPNLWDQWWSEALPYDPLGIQSAPESSAPAAATGASAPKSMPQWVPQRLPQAALSDDLCSASYNLFNVHPSELPAEVHDALKMMVKGQGEKI